MKKLLVLLLFVVSQAFGATATFTGNTSMELDNPERGFYFTPTGAEWCNGYLQVLRDGGVLGQKTRLALYQWNPAAGVSQMNTDLACVRGAGMKVLILPQYCASDGCSEGVNITTVQAQIAAARATFVNNADVIASVQMGVIGAWGEMHDSVMGLDTIANKALIRDALLVAVPKEIPLHMHQAYTTAYWYASPTEESTAFNGSARSRIGVANSCFMADNDDQSNYPGPATVVDEVVTTTEAQQRAYAAAQTEFTPFIFETCPASGSNGPSRKACTGGTDGAGNAGGIMNEGKRYHAVSGHRGYDTSFMDAWISGGCYADVNNLLGYRFQYDSLVHADSATAGSVLSASVRLRNYGWARPYSKRRLAVRLVKPGAVDIVGFSSGQLRQCPPQATTSNCGFSVSVPIPNDASDGDYDVYLEMPDDHASLASIPAYRAQPANANSGGQAWNATTRRFKTGTQVTISGGGGGAGFEWAGVTPTMWTEVNSQRSTFGDSNDCKTRVEAIPTSGGVTLSPGDNINTALASNDIVFLSGGTYVLTSPVDLAPSKKLVGVAGATVTLDAHTNNVDRGVGMGNGATLVNVIVDGATSFGVVDFYGSTYTYGATLYQVSIRKTGWYSETSAGSTGLYISGDDGIGGRNWCVVSSAVSNSWNAAGGVNANGGNSDGVDNSYGSHDNSYIDFYSFKNGDDGLDMWGGSDGANGGGMFCYFCSFSQMAQVDDRTNWGNGNGVKLGPSSRVSKFYKSHADNNTVCGWDLNEGSNPTPGYPVMVQSYGTGNGTNYCSIPTPP